MILDSSALVAIALAEPGHEALLAKVRDASHLGMGTPTLLETGMVLTGRLGDAGQRALVRLLEELEVEPIAFQERHWTEALRAFATYGRGRSEARLNFGDCMAYAVARVAGEPLLYVGDDFSRTDITAA